MSIKSGIFPDIWKTAKVVPIHKKGSTQDRGNFRPISILSTLSKLIERHIHSAFYAFLKANNLLHLAQSGFRHLFSCESALANIINKWTEAIDDDKLVGVILLDLRKAFDLIDHDILLEKLKLYKCSESTMTWFKSYLFERNQCTTFKGNISDKLPITTGVPQGSILGPLLFILFINDLPLAVKNSEIDMYADDSTATSTADTTDQLNNNLNADAENINNWCEDNRMAANTTKTKAALITTWQKRLSLPEDQRQLQVSMNGESLENVTSDKLLGVTIDHNLSWKQHIQNIASLVNSKLALLRRIKRYMPLSTRKLFYDTHILPHMDYCSTIWGSSPHVKNLLLTQKRAARVILDIRDICHPSKDMFRTLKWMPIHDRITYRKVTMVYKSLNDLTPPYMRNMFKYVKDTHGRTTRASVKNDLYLPPGKHKEVYTSSFAYSAALAWNNLGLNIRVKSSLNSFKDTYIKDYYRA